MKLQVLQLVAQLNIARQALQVITQPRLASFCLVHLAAAQALRCVLVLLLLSHQKPQGKRLKAPLLNLMPALQRLLAQVFWPRVQAHLLEATRLPAWQTSCETPALI